MHAASRFVFTGVIALLVAGPAAAQDDDTDLTTQLMRATVKIGNEKSTGTGFILCRPAPTGRARGQFVLVTAAHVFENMAGDEATLDFRRADAGGTYTKVSTRVPIRAEGKPLWARHATADVAVLVVVPPKGIDLPKIAPDLLATDASLKRYKIRPGDTVCCLGYPHRVEANAAGFAVLRSGPVASFPLTPTAANPTFLLSTNTFEGDSGGPVFLATPDRVVTPKGDREEVRLILGLVTGQLFLDEEMKMIYGTTKVRHRLGLGIVVQAAAIREALNRLP